MTTQNKIPRPRPPKLYSLSKDELRKWYSFQWNQNIKVVWENYNLNRTLEDTEEALRRSRKFSKMLENTLNSRKIVAIDESALRLFRQSKGLEYMEWLQFSDDEQKEFWISQYISLIS